VCIGCADLVRTIIDQAFSAICNIAGSLQARYA
jgi:hypothetical protein